MKAYEGVVYGQYGAVQELCTISAGIDRNTLDRVELCLCHNEKSKLVPLQILKNISYFIRELLLFIQYTLERMCSGLY